MKKATNSSDSIMSLVDLENVLPFGRTKLLSLLKANVLPVVKIGRDYITTKEHLEQWITENIGKEIFYE